MRRVAEFVPSQRRWVVGVTGLDVLASGSTNTGPGVLAETMAVVRSLLLPSLVSLFGTWNWYLPDRVAAILRVRPSWLVEARRPARVRYP
ncbi:MAG TPA: hypothetical protein VGJ44_09885 [Kribbellaceae bacterium]|jgi:RND superfamily putative drug exporter